MRNVRQVDQQQLRREELVIPRKDQRSESNAIRTLFRSARLRNQSFARTETSFLTTKEFSVYFAGSLIDFV
jgi:hypothetical protein